MKIGLDLKPIESLICRAVADGSLESSEQALKSLAVLAPDETLFRIAEKNQLEAQLAHVMLINYPESTPDYWRIAHEVVASRLGIYMKVLDLVSERLKEAGISCVALKNGGIARGIHPCLGCNPMGDLDIVVEKVNFRQAHQIMLDLGFNFEYRTEIEAVNLEAAEKSGGAEYWKLLQNGEKLWLELQWRPVAGRWIRADQEPKVEELMQRSIPIAGSIARLLSPEDNLLQVCLHTAKHSFVRAPGIRLHTDVDRIVRRQKINWELFISRVRTMEVKTAVFFSLAIPAEIFATPIPDTVFNQIKPDGWKVKLLTWWIKRAGLFNPEEKKFNNRLEYILFSMALYDDFGGIWRSIFPEKEWMFAQYRFTSHYKLPWFYLVRLFDLIFRHV